MLNKLMQVSFFKNLYLLFISICRNIPDNLYLKIVYRIRTGKRLNLKNPKTFNEKIQWLKLYDHNPSYITMVDKYAVRDYIRKNLGEKYLIPLIGGPWTNANDIDFDKLPEQFVLKCTHDSGSVIICRDKEKLDISSTVKKLNKILKRNFYYGSREWPYKYIKPQIIAEKYMCNSFVTNTVSGHQPDPNTHKGLRDYKFYCFNGQVKYLYVSEGMDNHKTAVISFLTPDWHFAAFKRSDYISFHDLPPKPANYDKMLQIAENLSKNFTFIRVDLYEIYEQIYFSELTFYPCSGFMPFEPAEWDLKLGNELSLMFKRRPSSS